MFYNRFGSFGKGVPKTLHDTAVDRLPSKAAVIYHDFVSQAFDEHFPQGVAPVLIGRSELGKTRLAAALGKRLASERPVDLYRPDPHSKNDRPKERLWRFTPPKGDPAEFATPWDIGWCEVCRAVVPKVEWLSAPQDTASFAILLRSGYEAMPKAQALVERWQRTEILVLDEIQLFPADLLAQILWPRAEACLPTIMTGNVALKSADDLPNVLPTLFGPAAAGVMHRVYKLTGDGDWMFSLQ